MVSDDDSNSFLRRAWRMGRMGLDVAGSYLGYQAQNLYMAKDDKETRQKAFHNKASRRIREELQDLKGPVMKLGQMLSMQSQLLPEAVLQELENLQMKAPAMHPTLMRSQFKASYGSYPEEIFREFDSEPAAAASLGQVHRARTKMNQNVAVKIQYPAIRRAIQNDFKLLRSTTFPGRLTGHVPADAYEELERGIMVETDYLQEASNLELFRKELRPLRFVTVPKVFTELSTDRILTMSFIEGVSMPQYLKNNPSQEQRDRLGARLFELFMFQTRRLHVLHADPHPGNYLFHGKERIGLVDFGCVKRFSADFVELLRCFADRIWLEGEAGFQRLMRYTWGEQVSPKNPKARQVMREAIRFSAMVTPLPENGSTIVDFGNPELLRTITRIWNESIRAKLANSEFIFFERAEMGLYNLLHQLGARIDTWKLEKKVGKIAQHP